MSDKTIPQVAFCAFNAPVYGTGTRAPLVWSSPDKYLRTAHADRSKRSPRLSISGIIFNWNAEVDADRRTLSLFCFYHSPAQWRSVDLRVVGRCSDKKHSVPGAICCLPIQCQTTGVEIEISDL